jgi:septal ring factor EnvC (AmiA/AmiB activator)
MWPKAIAQLIELAPHVSRLLPMADRFLNAKTADAEASRSAMQQMAEGLRGDLGQVTASHAGLYRQLNEQSEKLSELSSDVATVKRSVESLDPRLTRLEQQNSRLTVLLGLSLVLLAGLLVLAVILLLHHR